MSVNQPVDTLKHFVNGNPLFGPYPEGLALAHFGLGCFWGAERLFWDLPGVFVTAVGYMGGEVADPDYRLVCGGQSGHAEVVRVVFDSRQMAYLKLLQVFWEGHDPTQGMRQGNDVGSQYRSAIFCADASQLQQATSSAAAYGQRLLMAGRLKPITTEMSLAVEFPFYPAEAYHQQYLAKNPNGYCGLGGTGVSCPMPVAATTFGREG